MTGSELDDSTEDVHADVARVLDFCRRVARGWRVPLAVVVAGALACAAYLHIRKPAYRSETVILYSEGVQSSDDEERPETSRTAAVRFKEILMSRASLDTVMHEFDLYPDVRHSRGPVDAVEELRKHVEYRAPGGDTFSIGFTGASPTEAQHVTARLAELVVGRDSELRKSRAVATRDFLETEEKTTEDDLRDKEQALAAFMGAHPRFAFDTTPTATGAAFRASATAAPVRRAPATPVIAGEKSATVAQGGSVDASAARAPGAGEEARATAALAAARTNLAELMTRFTPAHPDVRAAAAEVDRAENRLLAGRGAPAPNAPETGTFDATPSSEKPARDTAASASPPARSVPRSPAPAAPIPVAPRDPGTVALETEWVKLTRAVTEARQHQDQIEAALFKASVAASSESGGHGVQVTVIDPAFLPEKPVPPGRTAVAGIFLAVSCVLGAMGAVLFALFDDRIQNRRDLARLAPILVEVPRLAARRTHAAS